MHLLLVFALLLSYSVAAPLDDHAVEDESHSSTVSETASAMPVESPEETPAPTGETSADIQGDNGVPTDVIPLEEPETHVEEPDETPVESPDAPIESPVETNESPTETSPVLEPGSPVEITLETTEFPTETPNESPETPVENLVETTESPSEAPVDTPETPVESSTDINESPAETPAETSEYPVETPAETTESPTEHTPVLEPETPIETTKNPTDQTSAETPQSPETPVDTPIETTESTPVETSETPSEIPIETTENPTDQTPAETPQSPETPVDTPIEITESTPVETSETPSETPVEITENPPDQTPVQTSETPVETTESPTEATPVEETTPVRAPRPARRTKEVMTREIPSGAHAVVEGVTVSFYLRSTLPNEYHDDVLDHFYVVEVFNEADRDVCGVSFFSGAVSEPFKNIVWDWDNMMSTTDLRLEPYSGIDDIEFVYTIPYVGYVTVKFCADPVVATPTPTGSEAVMERVRVQFILRTQAPDGKRLYIVKVTNESIEKLPYELCGVTFTAEGVTALWGLARNRDGSISPEYLHLQKGASGYFMFDTVSETTPTLTSVKFCPLR